MLKGTDSRKTDSSNHNFRTGHSKPANGHGRILNRLQYNHAPSDDELSRFTTG
jgi:hypothetical protein